MSINITEEQFKQFEQVRISGMFNMFDPEARAMTDLTKDEWVEIMQRYNSLKEKHGEKND